MSSENKGTRLGEILVKEGILTASQRDALLRQQETLKPKPPFGKLCVDAGIITSNQLQKLLRRYRKQLKLGELLVNMNLVTEEEVQQALASRTDKRERLGYLLVKQRIIRETDLIDALNLQLGIPKISPQNCLIDPTLVRKVKKEYLMEKVVIPAFEANNAVTVIAADPLDQHVINDMQLIFERDVVMGIATRDEILTAIEECFPDTDNAKDLFAKHGRKDLFRTSLIVSSDNSTPDERTTVALLDRIIADAIEKGASDIHFEPAEDTFHVRFRLDGILYHQTDLPLSIAAPTISRIKALSGLDIAEHRRHQDGRLSISFEGRDIDLRVGIYASIYGESATLRILDPERQLITVSQLGFSPKDLRLFENMLNTPSGLTLVTGPTGSGKTTTLYAALLYLLKRNLKIVTVEDPVEYSISGIVQGTMLRKVDQSYEDFLKAMMRQDPDVLMVGEIRDSEAARATIQAALTGHKVFTTFHTDDTTGALLRLMDMGIETFLITSTVICVVSQRLIRINCTRCLESYRPAPEVLASFRVTNPAALEKYEFVRGRGCAACRGTGYKGRKGIFELLTVNSAIRDAILQRKPSAQIRKIARETTRLLSLREDGLYKAIKGITTCEEVLRVESHGEADDWIGTTVEEIIRRAESEPASIA